MQRFIFPFCLFLSASLLFVIQPMAGKILLPVYGGTPAVWTVCMLFFQVVLLIAYAYVWFLSRVSRWRLVHLSVCLLSLIALPLTLIPDASHGMPELLILKNLLLQLGLPLLVIGSSAPLLQYAFSQSNEKRSSDPYFLYVASNVGSLLALLSYPWLIERFSGVSQQFHIWNGIYGLYLALMFWVLYGVCYHPSAPTLPMPAILNWKTRFTWIFLSFIPCSLMMGVTFYISTDIAATPLFWVLPLALYLLSFVVTFARKPIISHDWVVRYALFFLIVPIIGFIIGSNQIPAWQLILANLAGFFMLALLCHGELVRMRPHVSQLTAFYFCLALGGVLAGVFNGLIAPALFVHSYDYPLIILLAILSIPNSPRHPERSEGSPECGKDLEHASAQHSTKAGRSFTTFRMTWGVCHEWLLPSMVLALMLLNSLLLKHDIKTWHIPELLALSIIVVRPLSLRSVFLSMMILFLFVFMPWFNPIHILNQQRNFYGVKQVFSSAGAHVLMSQSTMHGFQVLQDKNPVDGARVYYASVLPVVQALQAAHQPLNAMVLGLGTGIMACQFRAKDSLSMIEIDEQVINIAKNTDWFTYLRDCPAHTTLLREDGRLAVAHAADASLELLVMDAFTSDAIPVHLLTLEAFKLYQKKITTDGVILVNVSNRHLHVLPVLTAAGRQLDMIVLSKQHAGNTHLGQLSSEWALLTTNEDLVDRLLSKHGWRFVAESESRLWTDDYSNIVPLLKW